MPPTVRLITLLAFTTLFACGQVSTPATDANVDDPDAAAADARPIDGTPIDAMDTASVTIAPASPLTADDLVATIGNPQGSYTIRWSENSVVRTDLITATVSSAETTKNEVWRVEIVNLAGVVVAMDQVTIGNTLPTTPVVSVPATRAPGTTVTCTIATPSTDADGDALGYTASWTENGGAYAGATTVMFTNDTVSAGDTQIGDSFVCSVTASDGTASGVPGTSAATTISCAGAPPGTTTLAYTGAIQAFTLSLCATTVTIEASGAQGGGGGGGVVGGRGAYVRGTFTGLAGTTLSVLVGGAGVAGTNDGDQAGGTGGGGTYVVSGAGSALVIAGGGGGAMGRNGLLVNGGPGQITTNGQAGALNGGAGGTGGGGGGTWPWTGWHSGTGGGGWSGDGSAPSNGSSSYGTINGQGIAYLNGGTGGTAGSLGRAGGFGGGGAAGFTGGGGGGYSGGGSGTHDAPQTYNGGGGGSINAGTSPSATAGSRAGNGVVVISWQ